MHAPFRYRKHPHLYEIHTWVWLAELSEAAGRRLTLIDVPDAEWDRLAELGFDFVWLMGIWKRSPAGRRIARTDPALFPGYEEALPGWTMDDIVGSAYAVQAYEPDPHLATWQELDLVREKLHARGMGLILDFVTNHTAPDHEWVRAHPEYYVTGTHDDFRKDPLAFHFLERDDGSRLYLARGRDPYFPHWADTAQLNYFRHDARQAILGELQRIAEHCDGLRCDMAMLVLNAIFARTWGHLLRESAPAEEFWAEAVAALPGFVWIAEVYWDLEWHMQQLGFPFAYDKRLMDYLHGAGPREVRDHLHADMSYQNALVRFLENHDEPRSAAAFGVERLPALATLVATLPGMRFYYDGQFEGRRIRPPVHLGRARREEANPALNSLYERLLHISYAEVFHTGDWRLLAVEPAGDASHESLLAWQWRSHDDWRLIVVNLGRTPAQGKLFFGAAVQPGKGYEFHDQLNDVNYPRDGDDLVRNGLYVRLDAGRAHLFAVKPRS